MILARRQFLRCLTGVIVAPAVMKADALMKVFAPKLKFEIYNTGTEWEESVFLKISQELNRRIENAVLWGDESVENGMPGFYPPENRGLLLLRRAEHSA